MARKTKRRQARCYAAWFLAFAVLIGLTTVYMGWQAGWAKGTPGGSSAGQAADADQGWNLVLVKSSHALPENLTMPVPRGSTPLSPPDTALPSGSRS